MGMGIRRYTYIRLIPRTIPGIAMGINVRPSSRPLPLAFDFTEIQAMTEVINIVAVAVHNINTILFTKALWVMGYFKR